MIDRTERTSLRVLVVEDESLIAFELSDLLEDLGHQVVGMAAAPEQAVRLIQTLEGGIDAAMVDANLAGVSSVPVIEALRRNGIPFAVTSGYDQEELAALGVDGIQIVKPYNRDDVRQTLSKLVHSVCKKLT